VRQLLANSIQALDCAGVVIRVMAEDEFLGQPVEGSEVDGKGRSCKSIGVFLEMWQVMG
jgi:hypothetical protein